MHIDDAEFEKLLAASVYRVTEREFGVSFADEESVRPSLRFRIKMWRLLRNPNRYVRSLHRPVYLKVLRTATAVLISAVILLGAAMAVSPEVRAAVGDFVRSWFSDHTEYSLPKEDGEGVRGKWTFGYIPDGFWLSESFASDLQQFYVYNNEASEYINIAISSGGNAYIDNEHSNFYQTIINGRTADVYESNTISYPNTILLFDDIESVIIKLTSDLEISELTKVAESIAK